MIVVVANEKGGTGKSTLSVNLAVARAAAGRDVLIVDTDPQGSAMAWAGERSAAQIEPRVGCVRLGGKGLAAELADLAKRYQDLIVDTGGRDSAEMRSAILAADLVVVPVQAAQADLWALERLASVLEQARGFRPDLRSLAVMTRATTHASGGDTEAARDFVSSVPVLGLATTIVRDRATWRRTFGDGFAVTEAKPVDPRAAAELMDLYAEIFGIDEGK